MKTAAIALDIDGTLTDHEKKILPETKQALMKAQAAGIRLILASGRPTSGLLEYARELEMEKNHGLLVSFNGARVTDCQSGEILFDQAMSVEDGKAVLEHMKNFQVKPMLYRDNYMYVHDVYDCTVMHKGKPMNIIRYEARNCNFLICEKEDLVEFVDFPQNKILTAGDDTYLQEHYKEMMEPFKDKLSCMFTADFYFEFTAKGIDKAKALETALPRIGCSPAKIMAFGDGQNDESMIRLAGIGVAMGNAVQSLKDCADAITESNENNGIAEEIYRRIPELVN